MGQNRIGERIESCCKEKKLSYYVLSRQAKVPLTTILHIVDGTTKSGRFYSGKALSGT